jgi:threonine aldolase
VYSFKNDYSEGAHPRLLEALAKNNSHQEEGYGLDRHSLAFTRRVREMTGAPDCGVHLIPGGTQTNLIAVSSFLRPHEACIAVEIGHISTHETGAIEATGHKIIALEGDEGKLSPEIIAPALKEHYFEHMVKPKLVYISQPTEMGTVYSKKELRELAGFCRAEGLFLYADGARLGMALTSEKSDVTLKDMYELTDAFFIGGTKNGALFGEALILRNSDVKEEFRYLIKQRGALLAKGWITGIQFCELFRNNLYFDLARHANEKARFLSEGLKAAGCRFLVDSPTNQIFPIMKKDIAEKLMKEYMFYPWKEVDADHMAVRLITSWATEDAAVERFVADYKHHISPA